jgi:hypothetical protein
MEMFRNCDVAEATREGGRLRLSAEIWLTRIASRLTIFARFNIGNDLSQRLIESERPTAAPTIVLYIGD